MPSFFNTMNEINYILVGFTHILRYISLKVILIRSFFPLSNEF